MTGYGSGVISEGRLALLRVKNALVKNPARRDFASARIPATEHSSATFGESRRKRVHDSVPVRPEGDVICYVGR